MGYGESLARAQNVAQAHDSYIPFLPKESIRLRNQLARQSAPNCRKPFSFRASDPTRCEIDADTQGQAPGRFA
jgi:hypothetical protein